MNIERRRTRPLASPRDAGLMRWSWALPWGAAAAAAAMLLMFLGRAAYQVRTLPERLVEWLLLFVPLDAFEAGIRAFGPQAKVYALDGGVAVMALLLWATGAAVLRRRWPPGAVVALAVALHLLTVALLLPLTGAGLFGTALFQDALLVNGVYLSAALAYG